MAIGACLCSCGGSQKEVYKDSTAPVKDRVEDLLKRMTLEEKVGQMNQFVGVEHIKANSAVMTEEELKNNTTITTDVIVGFPGETEEDFLETRKFLEKVHFYEMHIFKYSRRKGTVADKMKEQVADTVKSERSAVLLALEKAQSLEYRKMYIGKRLEVLIEELTEIDGRSYYTGYTKNYIRVAIAADEFKDNPVNDIYECMADKLICDGVTILARYN